MLTDTVIRSAKCTDGPKKLGDRGGLHLLLSPNGGKYWRFQYRFEGRQKTLALGVYPDVSLAKAREKHLVARQMLADGVDPTAEKQQPLQIFEDVAREWHGRWCEARNDRHAHYVLRRLETDVFPRIGRRAISDLVASDFRHVVQKIEARGAVDIAKRVLQTCGQIMRYAVVHDLIKHNPVADVKPSDILKPHKRRNYPRVDAKELPALLHAIDNYVGSQITRLGLQLMALTFVRTSELIGAKWSEFDLRELRWNIPEERMKMKKPHIVPLSTQSLVILEQVKAVSSDPVMVFPGDIDPRKPMSNNTLLYALYRLGYRGRMTGHGFRGVASTILHERDWPHAHIELQLAHQERNNVSAAYNHALYLKPRAEMMQAWADYLDEARSKHSQQRALQLVA